MKEKINKKYNLPEDFAAIVDGYLQDRTVIQDKTELLAFWKAALAAREKYPELQESIAEWAMSCGASSPLIDDQSIYEEIHFTFGELESAGFEASAQRLWKRIEKLIMQLGAN